MGKPQRRKGNPAKNKAAHRLQKNRNYRRDMDLIYEDIQGKRKDPFLTHMPEEMTPGLGQFYCTPCAKHFINKPAKDEHEKSKPHRRRTKLLEKEKPYNHKEAELLNK